MARFYQYEPSQWDLEIYAGSDYPIPVSYTDNAGTAIDITGWTFESQIRDFDDVVVATLSFSIVGLATAGNTIATLTKTQTGAWIGKNLKWDLFAILPGTVANGGGRRPIFTGNVIVHESVTVIP